MYIILRLRLTKAFRENRYYLSVLGIMAFVFSSRLLGESVLAPFDVEFLTGIVESSFGSDCCADTGQHLRCTRRLSGSHV